jgi:hypothetical protein
MKTSTPPEPTTVPTIPPALIWRLNQALSIEGDDLSGFLPIPPRFATKALLDLSTFGLEPDGRRAHLIPFGDEVQLILDYKRLVELVPHPEMPAVVRRCFPSSIRLVLRW